MGFLLASLAFLSPSTGWIAVLWGASGFGMGLHTLGGQSYLVDAARADALGTLSALYNWGYTLGGALGSPLAGFLLDRWDYRTFGTVLAALALGTIATNLLALPRLPTRAREQRQRLVEIALWLPRDRGAPLCDHAGPAPLPAHLFLGHGPRPDPALAQRRRGLQDHDRRLCHSQPDRRRPGPDRDRTLGRRATRRQIARRRAAPGHPDRPDGAARRHPGHRRLARPGSMAS